mmetsp:Transcript_40898/g.66258  ORF Transcript_40898/g.66258 Transcript_40898/m.66258 type:complete len:201 (+) Transcript_40898:195-797(+)
MLAPIIVFDFRRQILQNLRLILRHDRKVFLVLQLHLKLLPVNLTQLLFCQIGQLSPRPLFGELLQHLPYLRRLFSGHTFKAVHWGLVRCCGNSAVVIPCIILVLQIVIFVFEIIPTTVSSSVIIVSVVNSAIRTIFATFLTGALHVIIATAVITITIQIVVSVLTSTVIVLLVTIAIIGTTVLTVASVINMTLLNIYAIG